MNEIEKSGFFLRLWTFATNPVHSLTILANFRIADNPPKVGPAVSQPKFSLS